MFEWVRGLLLPFDILVSSFATGKAQVQARSPLDMLGCPMWLAQGGWGGMACWRWAGQGRAGQGEGCCLQFRVASPPAISSSFFSTSLSLWHLSFFLLVVAGGGGCEVHGSGLQAFCLGVDVKATGGGWMACGQGLAASPLVVHCWIPPPPCLLCVLTALVWQWPWMMSAMLVTPCDPMSTSEKPDPMGKLLCLFACLLVCPVLPFFLCVCVCVCVCFWLWGVVVGGVLGEVQREG